MKIDLLLLFFLYLAHSPFAQSINNNRDNSSGQNNVINRENGNYVVDGAKIPKIVMF